MGFKFGYKEGVATAAFILLVFVSIAAASFSGSEELVDPNINIEVQRSWITNSTYQNMTPVSGKVWHFVDVNVSNLNEDQPFQVSIPHFFAYTRDGSRVWVFNGEDYMYEPLDPGENQTVILVFHLREGVDITEIEYIQKLSEPVRCPVE
jgi:hypothetical protein